MKKKSFIALLICAVFLDTVVCAYPSYQIEDTVTAGEYERDEYDFAMYGWDVDKRGGTVTSYRLSKYQIDDTSTDFPIILKHELDNLDNFIYESCFNFNDLTDGFFISISNNNGSDLIHISANRNGWFAGNTKISNFIYDTLYCIKIKFKDGNYTVLVNGNSYGPFSVLSEGTASLIEIGTSNEYKCKFTMGNVFLSTDYIVNERFLALTDEWQYEGTVASIADSYDSGTEDASSLELTDGTISQSFATISGNSVAELKCRLDECSEFRMKIGNSTELSMENGKVYCGNEYINDYNQNVWQNLRIESSTENTKFFVNGKLIKNSVISDTIDCLTLTASGTAYIDDVLIFEKSGTVNYPIILENDAVGLNDNTYIGMQACYLMKNGSTQRGWDTFTPYDDVKPYLGYYDDGNTNVMNWELKWMAQHGIDYVMPCFYQPSNYRGGIVRPTNAAFENGYFMAQNSQYVRFALNLCNCFAKKKKPSDRNLNVEEINDNIENFKEFVIPYLCDRYFTDARYMKIDNRPLLYIWSPEDFKEHYGIDGTSEILTEIENECIRKGYSGIYAFAGADFAHSEDDIQDYFDMGFDYTFNYSTGGAQGDKSAVQKDFLTERKNMPLDAIANVSNGQNKRAWYKYAKNHKWMECSEYEELLTWIKNEYMTSYSLTSLASKMITIDNWNELGEGHFVQPTEYCGFGYLDAIRKVFASNTGHTDEIPNASQLQSLRGLQPQNRKILRYIRPYTGTELPTNVQFEWNFLNGNVPVNFRTNNVSGLNYSASGLSGTATSNDPVLVADVDFMAKDVEYIHVRMKIQPNDISQNNYISQVFFSTEDYPEVIQERAVGEYCVRGTTVDVYYDMYENKYWDGKVTSLRFDPMEKKGSFRIEKIEFLGEDAYTANINDVNYVLPCAPIYSEEILLPIESHGGILSRLNLYIEYKQNMLIIKGKDTITMNIDSKNALFNGESITLNAAPVLYRGAAMIPKSVFEMLGVSVVVADHDIIMTQDIEEPVIKQYPKYEWYFDYDESGWEPNQAIVLSDITNGIWRQRAKPKSSDPESSDPNITIDLSDTPIVGEHYSALEVRMRNFDAGGVMQLFFMGEEIGLEPLEANSITMSINNETEDFVTYTLDLSAISAWKNNTISKLRFDPVNKPGSYEIDYIKLCKKPDVIYGTVNARAGTASAIYTNTLSETDSVTAWFIAAFYTDNTLARVVFSEKKLVAPWESTEFTLTGMRNELYVKKYPYKMFVWQNDMLPCRSKILQKD